MIDPITPKLDGACRRGIATFSTGPSHPLSPRKRKSGACHCDRADVLGVDGFDIGDPDERAADAATALAIRKRGGFGLGLETGFLFRSVKDWDGNSGRMADEGIF